MAPAERVAVTPLHGDRKEVDDRASVHDQGAVHVGFAELELRLDQHAELRPDGGETDRHRRARAIAELQNVSASRGDAQIAASDNPRDEYS